MPRVKIDYIVSFSSEDPDNPASNLLSWEVSKKRWLCAKGETSCSVVLQLTKAVKISTLNIGTYNTAFVEVLVGRSEKPNEPFQVSVPRSVFLSPVESRRAAGGAGGAQRVRSFHEFSDTVATQRWDRLRVVCSQPYNKHCKFGLSFIQISEPEQQDAASTPAPAAIAPALIRLSPAPDSSDDDSFRPGELFAAVRNRPTDKPSDDAGSQIRHATSQALKNISDSATKLVKTPISKNKHTTSAGGDYGANRQRDDLLYTDDDDKPHTKIDHIVQRHKDDKIKNEPQSNKKKRKENTPEKEPSSGKKAKHNDGSKTDTSFKDSKKDTTPNNKRKKEFEDESNSCKKVKNEKHDASKNTSNDSFRKETKKDSYSSDRSKDEPSTSKKADFGRNEVKDNTKNESSSSRRDSGSVGHKKKSRKKSETEIGSVLSGVVLSLSGYVHPERGALRQLALDMGAAVQRDWGPACNLLVCAFANTPKLKQVRSQPGPLIPVVHADWLKEAFRKRRKPNWKAFAVESEHKEDLPESDSETGDDDGDVNEECDTDDEIEKVLQTQKLSPPSPSPSPAPDAGDTDCEQEAECIETIDPGRSLPALFEGRTFLLTGADGDVLKEWARYVRAYGGLVLLESELDEDSVVDYVLSADGRSPHADAARVRPRWLWRCHRLQRLLPAL